LIEVQPTILIAALGATHGSGMAGVWHLICVSRASLSQFSTCSFRPQTRSQSVKPVCQPLSIMITVFSRIFPRRFLNQFIRLYTSKITQYKLKSRDGKFVAYFSIMGRPLVCLSYPRKISSMSWLSAPPPHHNSKRTYKRYATWGKRYK